MDQPKKDVVHISFEQITAAFLLFLHNFSVACQSKPCFTLQ